MPRRTTRRDRPLAGDQARRPDAGEGRHELALPQVQLEIIRDQDLRPLQPAGGLEALAGGLQQRGRVGEATVHLGKEAAVQAGEEEEPAGVSGPRARRRGFQMLRLDSSHAQRGERARQRRGDRSARHVGGNERRRVLLEEAGGKEGVVAGVPGLQAAAEQ